MSDDPGKSPEGDDTRFSRQERLAEVGAAGQERIARSTAVVGGGRGGAVERLYLVGAGALRPRGGVRVRRRP
jgi:hypothetical protein